MKKEKKKRKKEKKENEDEREEKEEEGRRISFAAHIDDITTIKTVLINHQRYVKLRLFIRYFNT